ncbi:MAG TPA: hypothetical protein VFG73_07090 [Rhodanobacteraceae bacterium]|nr:hypothetical protein [Rhodanobacteraceae bacterium]
MHGRAWLLLLVPAVALLAWLAWPRQPTAARAAVAAPASGIARVAAAASAAPATPTSASETRSAWPAAHAIRPAATSRNPFNVPDPDEAQVLARAHAAADPLAALKALAAQGDAFAANDVGAWLVKCLPAAKARLTRMAAGARKSREMLAALPAAAASSDRVREALTRLDGYVEYQERLLAGCQGSSAAQAWEGFEWLDRAVAMGDRAAIVNYLATVAGMFNTPGRIGRDPQRAIRLRDRGRRYLGQLLRHCDRTALQAYAQYMPSFYQLGDYDRYAMAYLWHALLRSRGFVDADLHEQHDLDTMAAPLTPAARRTAQQQALAMQRRCLGASP